MTGSRMLPNDHLDGLADAFTLCFQSVSGRVVLEHLEKLYRDRRIAPTARDAELWHLEGQRSAIAYIARMVERGRERPGRLADVAPGTGARP